VSRKPLVNSGNGDAGHRTTKSENKQEYAGICRKRKNGGIPPRTEQYLLTHPPCIGGYKKPKL